MPSVWSATASRNPRPPLEGDITADVLVVGGGMSGILTAHMLREAGARCIVAEAKTVGNGATKNTTAKITAQHSLIYAGLFAGKGMEYARGFYAANTAAIRRYHGLSEHFPCDFEEKTAYVYATRGSRKLEREAEAYRRLGISSRIDPSPPLPFPVAGALAMDGQAQFHPLKLLYALADGLDVYENTFIRGIDGRAAYTDSGKITAEHIVLATHYPMINIPGLYFIKLTQSRSYIVAIEGAPLVDGMYIDRKDSGYSFRTYGDLLFVGGCGHKTGKKGGGYAKLRAFVKREYPGAIEKYSWAAQDCMSLDSVPYIGRHRAGAGNVYAATGFNKWGMTGSMVAAELISGLILSGKHEWENIFTPRRSMLTPKLFVNLGSSATGLLTPGGPRCTHMGCKLHRNKAENSWDCPCHGSRFDADGEIIDNPAVKNIRL